MSYIFTNSRTAFLVAACALAPVTSQAAWVVFDGATGWNHDIIIGVGENLSTSVTATMDAGPGGGSAVLRGLRKAGIAPIPAMA